MAHEIFFRKFWLKMYTFHRMEISKEEFDNKFKETLDTLIQNMAESPDINVKNFYNMTCVLENLAFFSPVIFDLIQQSKK
jgi:hypothetical protein